MNTGTEGEEQMTGEKEELRKEDIAEKRTTEKTPEAQDEKAGESASAGEQKAPPTENSTQARTSGLNLLMQSVSEEDDEPTASLTLKTILGGDILYAEILRKQLWLIVLVVFFAIAYVAFRYQCQQDMIAIDKMETELKDAKYKALSSSSTLTERCRESHVLEILKNNKDSLLKASDQPPYIINVPAE